MSGDDKEMLNQFDVGRGRTPLLGLEQLDVKTSTPMPEYAKEMSNKFGIERGHPPPSLLSMNEKKKNQVPIKRIRETYDRNFCMIGYFFLFLLYF
jgi:hypothetical protein